MMRVMTYGEKLERVSVWASEWLSTYYRELPNSYRIIWDIPMEQSNVELNLRFGDDIFELRFNSFDELSRMADRLIEVVAWQENKYRNSRLSLEAAIEDADTHHYFRIWNPSEAHEEAINVEAGLQAYEKYIKPKKRKMPKSA